MASSKGKKPPGLRQRKVTATEEPESPSCDQSLFIAFKKLKMNYEGGCVKKTEDQSSASLRHKQDVSENPPQDNQQAETKRESIVSHAESERPLKESVESLEDWSQTLQNFCFCEEGAVGKSGRPRWRSMCRYHRLRLKKEIGGKASKSSTNLVQAWHTHKPLLREGKLKVAEKPSSPCIMRAAKFNFKPSRNGEIHFNFVKPGDSAFSSKAKKSDSDLSRTERKAEPVFGARPKTPSNEMPKGPGNARSNATSSSQSVFAAEASKRLQNFSSFASQAEGNGATSSCKPVPKFEGHRASDRSNHQHGTTSRSQARSNTRSQALWSQQNVQALPLSSNPNELQGASAVTAAPSRLELPVERSCSQEARLDESEFNVNELAAYFDNFLYMPKDMSSMAQMMYT